MPRSSNEGKEQIKDWVTIISPVHQRILDVAVGQGTYHTLFKDLKKLKLDHSRIAGQLSITPFNMMGFLPYMIRFRFRVRVKGQTFRRVGSQGLPLIFSSQISCVKSRI